MTALSVRRVASVLLTVAAVVLVGAFVVQAVPGLVGADASYVVLSGSMEPTISPGDAVIVQSVAPADIESGDVITYERSGESTPVTHRVVEVLEREDGLAFRTAGDANDAPDPQPVPAESVTGEVWFAIPYIGHVVLFANTPTGLATLVGLPIVAFVVSELYELARDDASGDGDAVDATAAADSGTASTTPATDAATGDEATEGVAITSTDLRLSGVAFAALAAYSGYVASLRPTPLRVGIFAGAAMIVVFVGVVFLFGQDTSRNAPDVEEITLEEPSGTGETATDGGASDGAAPEDDSGGAAPGGGDDDA